MSLKPVPGSRPGTFIVRYQEFAFELDITVCRRVLAESQVAGDLDSPEALDAVVVRREPERDQAGVGSRSANP